MKASKFNSTQQPPIQLQTEGSVQAKSQAAYAMPGNQISAANRPNTNIIGRQSMSIRSKFSRENSVTSGGRQET